MHLVRAVLRNVAKKYHKEIADKLKIALTDETKMQNMIDLAIPSLNRTPSDRMRRMRSPGWNGAPFTIPRACSRPSCSGAKAEALKLQARHEDLNVWEKQLVKESKGVQDLHLTEKAKMSPPSKVLSGRISFVKRSGRSRTPMKIIKEPY
jgi:hypothetical protein